MSRKERAMPGINRQNDRQIEASRVKRVMAYLTMSIPTSYIYGDIFYSFTNAVLPRGIDSDTKFLSIM